jgi:hypothetical protein
MFPCEVKLQKQERTDLAKDHWFGQSFNQQQVS